MCWYGQQNSWKTELLKWASRTTILISGRRIKPAEFTATARISGLTYRKNNIKDGFFGTVRNDQERLSNLYQTLAADSQGTSTVLCGDDLKSKLGSLPAQPILRTPDGVFFRLVKDALVVCLLCASTGGKRFGPVCGPWL
jgi:hypothetical protein